MRVLAIDPGGTSGWAIINTEFNPPVERYGECAGLPKFFHFLDQINPGEYDLIVCEDYLINNKKFDHQFSRAETIQVIGVVRYISWLLKIPLKMQPNNVKKAGYGYIGRPNQHKHFMDAVVHGIYWGVKAKKLDVTKLKMGA